MFYYLHSMQDDNNYKLDKSSFSAMTLKEADDEMNNYKNETWQERLRIANYLNSIAFQFPLNNPPRMDKLHFEMRKLINE